MLCSCEVQYIYNIYIYIHIIYIVYRAKNILDRDTELENPMKIELQEDRSINELKDTEFPGFIFIKLGLYSPRAKRPQHRHMPKHPETIDYQLRIELYVARNLPAADKSGSSDPMVVFRCAGNAINSNTKNVSLNPNWFESYRMDVKLPKNNEGIIKYSLTGLVYDVDSNGNDLLGICDIPLEGEASYYQSIYIYIYIYV